MQEPSASANAKCDYDVYLLQTTPDEEWNHGQRSGIAISEKRKEILYWAKIW